jgi:hypothetical protein
MPITITATPGSASANSFATAAEMTAYCLARLNATIWTGADAQLPALVEATRDLNLLEYVGSRTDAVQALSWPRAYAPNPDAPFPVGPDVVVYDPMLPTYFPNNAIPQRVKDATCELALQYLKLGTTDAASIDRLAGVIEKKVDVLITKWDSGTHAVGLGRWPRVMGFIEPLLSHEGGLEVLRT